MAPHKTRITTISWKLTLIYAVLFSLALVLLNAATLVGVRYFLYNQAVGQVVDISEMINERVEKSDKTMEDLADEGMIFEIPSNDNIYVKIVDPRGHIINESAKFNLKIPQKIPVENDRLAFLNRNLLYKNEIIQVNGRVIAYLQVVKNLSNELGFLRVLFVLMILADLAGVVISFLAGFLLSRNMLRPIAGIAETAQSISVHGDLDRRIEIDGPADELTHLAKTFNAMIGRLQNAFEQQNQFVSNASHELRTPVQVIQGYINLLDRWGKEDKEILQEAISAVKNETANMAVLIERLLFLARGDSGAQALLREEFQLETLVEEVIEEFRIIAGDLVLTCNSASPIMLYADRKLIKQMLRAVIDNSIKFTPPGGRITIDTVHLGETIEIAIADTGVGIPESDIPRIFERFYQVDQARIKDRSGSGLGLAIVKWIVEVHEGQIRVESALGQGTCVRVILPDSSRLR